LYNDTHSGTDTHTAATLYRNKNIQDAIQATGPTGDRGDREQSRQTRDEHRQQWESARAHEQFKLKERTKHRDEWTAEEQMEYMEYQKQQDAIRAQQDHASAQV
jgi:hypothetical protein